jgi:hypothetical protein
MREVIRVTGIAPLPVHDSFIVPISQQEHLMKAMENALPCGNAAKKSLVGTHPNLATSYPLDLKNEPSETVPQYGMDGLPGMGGRDGTVGRPGLPEPDRHSRESLMDYVASVIRQQLDEHEARHGRLSFGT